MGSGAEQTGFTPYIGEGFISPNRQLVTDLVKDIATKQPSFARAIQKRCLGSAGRMALPVTFMSKYLTGTEGEVFLEDNHGLFWKVNWIAYMQSGRRLAFTRGWPAFVAHHNVKDGDVFVAEILAPDHLKVRVISSNLSSGAHNMGMALGPAGSSSPKEPTSYYDNGESQNIKDPISHNENRESQTVLDSKERSESLSPLAFLLQENKILKRKRSKTLRSLSCCYSHLDELSSLKKHLSQPFPPHKSSADMNSLIETRTNMDISVQLQEDMKQTSCRDMADRSVLTKGEANIREARRKIFNKRKNYEAHSCQYGMETCNFYALHGFKFCMLHILEDPAAPYKQCDFMEELTKIRCGFPVCLNLPDSRFCQIHMQSEDSVSCKADLGMKFSSVLPALGQFSSLVMAVDVSHHFSNKAEVWIAKKVKFSIEKDFSFNQGCKSAAIDGPNCCLIADAAQKPVPFCERTDMFCSQHMELVAMKVSAESIGQYVGWKLSESLTSAAKNISSSHIAAYEAVTAGGKNEKRTEHSRSISCLGHKSFNQSTEEAILNFDMEAEQQSASASFATSRRAGCSRFVGVRKRRWGAYGAEIRTPEGKRLWLGTFSTEEEAATAYDDAARIFRGDSAVTNFSRGLSVHTASPLKSDYLPSCKQESAGIFSEAPKRRRTSAGKKRRGINKHINDCDLQEGVLQRHIEESNLDRQSLQNYHKPENDTTLLDRSTEAEDSHPDPELGKPFKDISSADFKTDNSRLKWNTPCVKISCSHSPSKDEEERNNKRAEGRGPNVFLSTETADCYNARISLSSTKKHGVGSRVLCDNSMGKRRFRSLSLGLPAVDEGDVPSDDSDFLCGFSEPRVAAQLHRRFTELKDEPDMEKERSTSSKSEILADIGTNGEDYFACDEKIPLSGCFQTCQNRRNRVCPGELEILNELDTEDKKLLSLGLCLKL